MGKFIVMFLSPGGHGSQSAADVFSIPVPYVPPGQGEMVKPSGQKNPVLHTSDGGFDCTAPPPTHA